MDDANQIEEIKNRLDIVQVVGKYVQLKQAGKNFSGLCPFHHEKTPSFIVSPDIQRYKCFGCGETGDIFNFVQKVENIDFAEALEKLAKEAGVELKKYTKNPKYSRLEDINYLATKYYYKALRQNPNALKYVKNRGFSDESIKIFGIGYAPKYPKLLLYIGKKYTKEELINSGLFVDKNGTLKEKFYDRIMFPIRSTKGKVIGFTGRILPGNDYGPKYMNSPDTLIFHKKMNLFGQYEARQEIRKQDLAILCEGSTDVISAYQHGTRNILAPLGTGLTKEQLSELSRITKNILFFFDSDSAGQAAVIRAFKLASELNLYPYATNSSPYKDIDEMMQKDPDHLQMLIRNKQEAFSYIFSNFIKERDLSQLKDLTETKKFLEELLTHVTDQTLKKHYNDKANRLGQMIFNTNGENSGKVIQGSNITINPVKQITNQNVNILEKTYLQLLIYNFSFIRDYQVPIRYFSSETLQEIYKTLLVSPIAGDISSIIKLFDKDEEKKLLIEDIILSATEMEIDSKKQLEKVTKRLKKEYLNRRQRELRVKIAIAEESNDVKKIDLLLKKVLKITKILKDISHD
jgi:DNA primase